jgi:hypothetical protein
MSTAGKPKRRLVYTDAADIAQRNKAAESAERSIDLDLLAVKIKGDYGDATTAQRHAVKFALACGHRLNAARRLLKELRTLRKDAPTWKRWVEERCEMSLRTSYYYRTLDAGREQIEDKLDEPGTSMQSLLRFLRGPDDAEEDREEAVYEVREPKHRDLGRKGSKGLPKIVPTMPEGEGTIPPLPQPPKATPVLTVLSDIFRRYMEKCGPVMLAWVARNLTTFESCLVEMIERLDQKYMADRGRTAEDEAEDEWKAGDHEEAATSEEEE